MYDGPILFSGELSGGADISTTRLQRYASEGGGRGVLRELSHTQLSADTADSLK